MQSELTKALRAICCVPNYGQILRGESSHPQMDFDSLLDQGAKLNFSRDSVMEFIREEMEELEKDTAMACGLHHLVKEPFGTTDVEFVEDPDDPSCVVAKCKPPHFLRLSLLKQARGVQVNGSGIDTCKAILRDWYTFCDQII